MERSSLRDEGEKLKHQRLLALRTGSLYDFVTPAPNETQTGTTESLPAEARDASRGSKRQQAPKRIHRRIDTSVAGTGTGQALSITGAVLPGPGSGLVLNMRGNGHLPRDSGRLSVASSLVATSGKRGSVATSAVPAKPSRLEQTLNKYRFVDDPVTREREALRSLDAKNSFYPTLRFVKPWDEREIDSLDEYMSSSSDASSPPDDSKGGSGGKSKGRWGGSEPALAIDTEPGGLPLTTRTVKELKKELRRRRRRITQARQEFNIREARVLSMENAEQAAQEVVDAAAVTAAPASTNLPQVDVSKLAHFRYSKIKGTLSVGSEPDWISDELYQGSSVAASDGGHHLPPEFYGSGARPRFYDLYRLVHRQMVTIDNKSALDDGEFTPRRLFLRDALARGSVPSPAFMRKSSDPHSLDLSFHGLGDKLGKSLAASLPYLPLLASLNLRENRLTDASLEGIIAEAITIESLTSLDLSSNKIDASACMLRQYVASSSCTLRKLSLSDADIDDNECSDLMEALATNLSLTALDLSRNIIGSKETYNFVCPDFTTGGEAIATMLEMNVTLLSLDISWNSIRLVSGITLGQSLVHNSALTELNLAHNGVAEGGTQAIAQSLRSNGTLKLLNISFNSLTPRSAMVLGNALLDNTSLVRLVISHNNVGRSGARAILMALRQRTRPGVDLLIDLQSCGLGAESEEGLFDMYSPSGSYDLDLSNPYDYMVARTLLSTVNKSEGCELTDVKHSVGERGVWKPITLVRRAPAPGDSFNTADRWSGGTAVQTSSDDPAAPNKFGERMLLGARCFGGRVPSERWRQSADALQKKIVENGTGGVEPADVERFFRDLGFDPEEDISRRVCSSLNETKCAEWGRQREGGGDHGRGHNGECKTGDSSTDEHIIATANISSARASEKEAFEDHSAGARVVGSSPKTPFDLAKYVFELLFFEMDVDWSGCINYEEFVELLRKLGGDVNRELVKHCIASYDIDRSNTLEAGEFVDFMAHEFLTPPPPSVGEFCEGSSEHAWHIPREGRLCLTVIADYVAPSPGQVASQEAVDALVSSIIFSSKTEKERFDMFQLATEGTDFYMTSLSAQTVIDQWNNGINLVDIVEIMLPQMASERNVVSLIESNLTYVQILELRSKLGQAWGALVGNPTGYYCLDMSSRRHVIVARRLAMINYAEKAQGMSSTAVGHDTSQRGHWNNFRNETFNGDAFPGRGLDSRWFVNMPTKGKLRLDYVSTTRPLPGTNPLSERRFQQLLNHLDLGDMKRCSKNPALFEPPECTPHGGEHVTPDWKPNIEHKPTVTSMASAGSMTSSSGVGQSTDKAYSMIGLVARTVSINAVSAPAVSVLAADASESGDVGRVSTRRLSEEEQRALPRTRYPSSKTALPPRLPLKSLEGHIPSSKRKKGTSGGGSYRSGSNENCAASGWRGTKNNELVRKMEIAKTQAMIKKGELKPIAQDKVLAFRAEFQVTTKAERRRAWAISEFGLPLVPDEDNDSTLRTSGASGGNHVLPGHAARNLSMDATLSAHHEEAQGDLSGLLSEGPPDRATHKGDAETGVDIEGTAAASTLLADSKPNFGDQQKSLYHSPLMWRGLLEKHQYTQEYKMALNKLCELRVQVLRHHLTVTQVITTMNFFPRCDHLRVIAAITLFGRLVDLGNLDVLLAEFTQTEEEEFMWRIGPLNCHNPMKPDRLYDLDLTHRDDREVCKILATLAVEEPGVNWISEEYRWSYTHRPVPGWKLPISWTTPDNVPNGGPRYFGRLTLTYTSEAALGCAPRWKLRESLMAHVLAGHKPLES